MAIADRLERRALLQVVRDVGGQHLVSDDDPDENADDQPESENESHGALRRLERLVLFDGLVHRVDLRVVARQECAKRRAHLRGIGTPLELDEHVIRRARRALRKESQERLVGHDDEAVRGETSADGERPHDAKRVPVRLEHEWSSAVDRVERRPRHVASLSIHERDI